MTSKQVPWLMIVQAAVAGVAAVSAILLLDEP